MKLLRLKLETWRGVGAREVNFANGVTLIEGPNEIGKSTIVEALQALFTVMDSSNRSDIKAIQPVGTDVGSRVEAEIQAGDYHFVYSKTYNRDRQTMLKVLAPNPEQLTGREAHERVEQILEESVDMALWHALLVEQGNEIAGVTLAQSDGLARALDEAAGGAAPEQDDSDLFLRVQGEYERYFTLKTGKPKFADLKSDLNKVRDEMETARDALAEVEADSENYQLCLMEIRRLEAGLPELEQEKQTHEANWQAVTRLRGLVNAKHNEFTTVEELTQAARDDMERRRVLANSVVEGAAELENAREALAPHQATLNNQQQAVATATEQLAASRARLNQARAVANRARLDNEHAGNVVEHEAILEKLRQLKGYREKLAAARKALQGVKIDSEGLETLRDADNDLQVAMARVSSASSSIEISAEETFKLGVNDEAIDLAVGDTVTREFAAELNVTIPGVASIRVMPSQSANELERAAAGCREDCDRLLKQYGVKDLPDAIAKESKRAADEKEKEVWLDRIADFLGSETEPEWQAAADDLHARCKAYKDERAVEPELPATVESATAAKEVADKELLELEAEVETLLENREGQQEALNEAIAGIRIAETNANGLEVLVRQREQDLRLARDDESDEEIENRVAGRAATQEGLQQELATLTGRLDSATPEAAKALFTNAQAALERATGELTGRRTELAVLEDRLTNAQADGRFETVEALESKVESLEREYAAIHARAMAAHRLWEVIGSHREAARKSYVRPLKEGVEQLGKIVFGSDFRIELGDDWSISSCTRDGKTIPFDDLSVGAKEQLGILMRLAAARIVSSQGGVPLIIDDALGFSDPSRLKTMGAAIASAGNDCQVILLTCSPGRFTHVGNADVVRF